MRTADTELEEAESRLAICLWCEMPKTVIISIYTKGATDCMCGRSHANVGMRSGPRGGQALRCDANDSDCAKRATSLWGP